MKRAKKLLILLGVLIVVCAAAFAASKLNPELKFSYSLMDAIDKGHADELTDATQRVYTNSVTSGHAKMITLTFYFE